MCVQMYKSYIADKIDNRLKTERKSTVLRVNEQKLEKN